MSRPCPSQRLPSPAPHGQAAISRLSAGRSRLATGPGGRAARPGDPSHDGPAAVPNRSQELLAMRDQVPEPRPHVDASSPTVAARGAAELPVAPLRVPQTDPRGRVPAVAPDQAAVGRDRRRGVTPHEAGHRFAVARRARSPAAEPANRSPEKARGRHRDDGVEGRARRPARRPRARARSGRPTRRRARATAAPSRRRRARTVRCARSATRTPDRRRTCRGGPTPRRGTRGPGYARARDRASVEP